MVESRFKQYSPGSSIIHANSILCVIFHNCAKISEYLLKFTIIFITNPIYFNILCLIRLEVGTPRVDSRCIKIGSLIVYLSLRVCDILFERVFNQTVPQHKCFICMVFAIYIYIYIQIHTFITPSQGYDLVGHSRKWCSLMVNLTRCRGICLCMGLLTSCWIQSNVRGWYTRHTNGQWRQSIRIQNIDEKVTPYELMSNW